MVVGAGFFEGVLSELSFRMVVFTKYKYIVQYISRNILIFFYTYKGSYKKLFKSNLPHLLGL